MTPQPTTPKPSDEQVQAANEWHAITENEVRSMSQETLEARFGILSPGGRLRYTYAALDILASALAWAEWEKEQL